jgi:NADH:ubiquinone oxidoreductase subunit K
VVRRNLIMILVSLITVITAVNILLYAFELL